MRQLPFESPLASRIDEAPPHERSRHALLDWFLTFNVLAFSLVAGINLVAFFSQRQVHALDLPEWVIPAMAIGAMGNVVGVTGVLIGKRWGFYVYASMCLFMCAADILQFADYSPQGHLDLGRLNSVAVLKASLFPFGVAFLFVLLRHGGARSVWSQLE